MVPELLLLLILPGVRDSVPQPSVSRHIRADLAYKVQRALCAVGLAINDGERQAWLVKPWQAPSRSAQLSSNSASAGGLKLRADLKTAVV